MKGRFKTDLLKKKRKQLSDPKKFMKNIRHWNEKASHLIIGIAKDRIFFLEDQLKMKEVVIDFFDKTDGGR